MPSSPLCWQESELIREETSRFNIPPFPRFPGGAGAGWQRREQWQETGRGARDFLLAGRGRRREGRHTSDEWTLARRPGPQELGSLKLQ